jgi:hypothetical protein
MQQSSPIEEISSPRVAAADNKYDNRGNLFGSPQGMSIPPAVANHNNQLFVCIPTS